DFAIALATSQYSPQSRLEAEAGTIGVDASLAPTIARMWPLDVSSTDHGGGKRQGDMGAGDLSHLIAYTYASGQGRPGGRASAGQCTKLLFAHKERLNACWTMQAPENACDGDAYLPHHVENKR